jgi:hypothetical protein
MIINGRMREPLGDEGVKQLHAARPWHADARLLARPPVSARANTRHHYRVDRLYTVGLSVVFSRKDTTGFSQVACGAH